MTINELKSAATSLFTWFADTRFENDGVWDRETNLLFAFDDFVSRQDDFQLMDLIDSLDRTDAINLRKLVEDGTVYCLNHKNLTFWGAMRHEQHNSIHDSLQSANV